MICRLVAVICGLSAVVLISAQTTKPAIDPKRLAETGSPNLAMETPRNETEWDKGNLIVIHNEDGVSEITCRYEINDAKNIRITENGHLGPAPRSGQIMLIDGRWILTKDIAVMQGYEVDELDHPLLDLKLVLYLLSNLAPQGPSEIKEKAKISVKKKQPFVLATVSAYLAFDGPWKLEGNIDPVGPDKDAFDFKLTTHQSTHLTGTWQKDKSLVAFTDDTSVSGWWIYEIGMDRHQKDHMMLYDYVAKPSTLHPQTVGKLRQLAKQ